MIQRIRITARGSVQGVGFRPFVFRLASEMGLPGRVVNTPQGVMIEAEGEKSRLDSFLFRVQREAPPRSRIRGLELSFLDPAGFPDFRILNSESGGEATAEVHPDIAVCSDCIGEISDPSDRRYLYPFTNCTNCGPRFTIIESLPYDRPNTVMRRFEMCADCRAEYENPLDRRFHAQPIACAVCGPRLEWRTANGRPVSTGPESLLEAALEIESGRVVAVKGLGGFHLMADAANDRAVRRLRDRKRREEKPLAVLYPSIESIKEDCDLNPMEERLLASPESPIVLVRRKPGGGRSSIAPSVAPGNPFLGVMLPYTPLHYLLMKCLGRPIVATSGNLSDETICTDESEAEDRLGGIADGFLVHDRPIARHADDSIARVVRGREMILRRARGYAPVPIRLKNDSPPRLAVGGHMKNTVALSVGRDAILSQHIGDLEAEESFETFKTVIRSFSTLYKFEPEEILCDLHPDYRSTRFAESAGLLVRRVQHHIAHMAACMAENELEGEVLGVSWDGTGYGTDGTVWGGEFFHASNGAFRRIASLRPFRLPGNAAAVREPRRAALGLLHEILGETLFEREGLPPVAAFPSADRVLLGRMLSNGLNAPETSSAGRLFDAVSSLLGVRHVNRFEGQAAMELEFASQGFPADAGYPFRIEWDGEALMRIDWEPMIREMLRDIKSGKPVGRISAQFHQTLAEMILAVARKAGVEKVALSGGCFQNMVLLDRTVDRLERSGFRPYWHQRIPTNDGGIALGQAAAAGFSAGVAVGSGNRENRNGETAP